MERNVKRVAVGCDQVAFPLKESVLEHLRKHGVDILDIGAYSPDVVVDYPDYAQKVALLVSNHDVDGGIVMCGTGLGVSMAANKVKGARVALCHDVFTAHQSRAHNDANILAMGAWIVSPQRMEGIVDEWLETSFEGGRHTSRVNSLDRYMETDRSNLSFDLSTLRYAMALSLRVTGFGPLLFQGRIEQGFAALEREGFRFVEISLRNADDIPFEDLSLLLQKYKLQVTALATGQGCLHDQRCFSAVDPELQQGSIQRFKTIIDLASRLGANVIFGGVRGKLTGSPEERSLQKEKVMESFHDCDQYAEKRGVVLLVEPINRYETNYINTAAEAVDFIDQTGSRSTKVLLDAFHMNFEEVDIPTSIRLTGEKLGYFHLVDSNRLSPGQGHLDFKGIFATLSQIGFCGPVSAEILPIPDDESAVVRTRNFLESLGASFGR
jgi:RpiB/LacA/LacB family sugar-phosphate isomerase